jgi:hypothetical protein
MSGYDKLWTLAICLGQLLASKIHGNFNLRNKITVKNNIPHDFRLPSWEKITPSHTSPIWCKIF